MAAGMDSIEYPSWFSSTTHENPCGMGGTALSVTHPLISGRVVAGKTGAQVPLAETELHHKQLNVVYDVVFGSSDSTFALERCVFSSHR